MIVFRKETPRNDIIHDMTKYNNASSNENFSKTTFPFQCWSPERKPQEITQQLIIQWQNIIANLPDFLRTAVLAGGTPMFPWLLVSSILTQPWMTHSTPKLRWIQVLSKISHQVMSQRLNSGWIDKREARWQLGLIISHFYTGGMSHFIGKMFIM